jgi:hypothetical protein
MPFTSKKIKSPELRAFGSGSASHVVTSRSAEVTIFTCVIVPAEVAVASIRAEFAFTDGVAAVAADQLVVVTEGTFELVEVPFSEKINLQVFVSCASSAV